ncbi:unnamed protein product [Schistosoma margrebowiei]|uniref:SCP domain-containing protein n=1 Tax=Schistosoma margrebowiei TaxID=48269 RepID=A0A183N4N6_9TREM|nr:unnamed protein product [Schistosoma margrebowiei]
MKTSTSEGKHGIQWTSRMPLDDLDFAHDLALLSQTQQQMQEKTNSVAAASAAVGLNIHKEKSKILQYNTACTNPVTINGEDFENVKPFTYLGCIIDEHGGSDEDVKARIGKARAAYLQLRNIWNSKQLSTNTKMVWANTTDIGCGVATCANYRLSIVCNYGPSGNWTDEKPYEVKSRELCPEKQNNTQRAPLSIANVNHKLSSAGLSRNGVHHQRPNSQCISLNNSQNNRRNTQSIWTFGNKALHKFSKSVRDGSGHGYVQ